MSESNTVSPLRQRMIEDMAARKLNPHTQRSHIYGIVRVNSILRARAPGRVGAPLFLLTNCRRAWPDSTPKIAYTYLP